MKSVSELTRPITVGDFKKYDKVCVFDDLVYGNSEREDYVKTYVYDKKTNSAYLKRELIKMSNGKGNGCNFSNSKVSLNDVVDSINWHIKNGEIVEVYFDDML